MKIVKTMPPSWPWKRRLGKISSLVTIWLIVVTTLTACQSNNEPAAFPAATRVLAPVATRVAGATPGAYPLGDSMVLPDSPYPGVGIANELAETGVPSANAYPGPDGVQAIPPPHNPYPAPTMDPLKKEPTATLAPPPTATATPIPDLTLYPATDCGRHPGLPGCVGAGDFPLQGQLAYVDLLTGELTVLNLATGTQQQNAVPGEAVSWAPDGQRLLRIREQTTPPWQHDLYSATGRYVATVMDAEATNSHQVMYWLPDGRLLPNWHNRAFSSDGRTATLVAEDCTHWQIIIDQPPGAIDEENESLHFLIEGTCGRHISLISWDPSGRWILYENVRSVDSNYGHGNPLSVLDTETGDSRFLEVNLLYDLYADFTWHPTQPGLLAVGDGGTRHTLALLDLYAGTSYVPFPDCDMQNMAWSPDGRLLAFGLRQCGSQAPGIYTLDIETKTITAVVGNVNGYAHWPQWSADGTYLIYITLDYGAQLVDVHAVLADGSQGILLLHDLPGPNCGIRCLWEWISYTPYGPKIIDN